MRQKGKTSIQIKDLKKILDDWYSRWIRLKYTKKGYCECYTCGRKFHPKDLQNGHFFSRTFTPTRWDDDNCRPQCVQCNIFKEGNKIVFSEKIRKELGEKRYLLLEARKTNQIKMDRFEYNLLISEYEKKVNDLLIEKNIEKWW